MIDLQTTNFVALVWTMRQRQKLYFARPIKPRLIAAKEAEKEVDEWLDNEQGVRELPFRDPIPAEDIPY
jgi:hypothetical protein